MRAKFAVHFKQPYALRQFIHQFIQVPDFLRQRVFYFFYPVAADDACYQVRIRMKCSLLKEGFETGFSIQHFLEFVIVKTSEPLYHLV